MLDDIYSFNHSFLHEYSSSSVYFGIGVVYYMPQRHVYQNSSIWNSHVENELLRQLPLQKNLEKAIFLLYT